MITRLTVFCGSTPGTDPRWVDLAHDVGAELARREIGVVYGAGGGLVKDETLPEGSAAAELAQGYRAQLHSMGTVGTRDVLEAAGLADPLDHDLLDHIWESIVEAAVAWWQEHDDHTAEQMAQRLTRLLAVVTLRG